jgi:hypothetical protein
MSGFGKAMAALAAWRAFGGLCAAEEMDQADRGAGGKAGACPGSGGSRGPPAATPKTPAHRTAQSDVSRILDPVRQAAKSRGVPLSDLGRLFVKRFGHTTREATVEEAMAFARLAIQAPTDDGARFIEFMRSAATNEAA